MRISVRPRGLSVEIRPLVRTRAGRVRMAAAASAVLVAALAGAGRLAEIWEAGLKRGQFGDLPLPVLLFLSVAIGISTPLALLGLAALAFAEETIEVDPDSITIRTAVFETARVETFKTSELECWRETYLPLPPWWTWAVRRLAARCAGRLRPIAGAAGPREKKLIGQALAAATGKPVVDDWGRSRDSRAVES